jgi:hypothetical protein
MNISVVLLDEIKAVLPPALREKLETAMRKSRAEDAKKVKKFRNGYSNGYAAEGGKCDNHSNGYSNGYIQESGEILPKTLFLGKNCDNHVSRGGERGGLYFNNSTSVLTLSDNDVTRVDTSSFKNTSLNKGTERTSPEEKNAKKINGKCDNHASLRPESAPRHELLRIAMAAGISEEMFHSWHGSNERSGWRDKSGRPITHWLAALKAYSLKAQIGRAGQ